ncbi:MAG: aconitase X catalytic domain-containing protein [Promethearchaeati archaeon]
MYIDKSEERILNGEFGAIKAKAMRILITLGDIFEADKLIPIESVQVSGISYKTIGDAGLKFLEDWSDAQVVVETRMNPAGMDLIDWKTMGISEYFANKQLRIINALTSMGIKKSCTCTPYHAGLVPNQGTHVAWSESSAVVFANSVLGAMTNREGGPSALSAALIGKTPNYGMHLEENRVGEVVFKINHELTDLDFSLLGYYIGKKTKNKIPIIEGIKKANQNQLKALGAGAAASGGISMFMIKNVTPEYKIIENPEIIDVEYDELTNIKNDLTNCINPDIISFGCPHLSLEEVKDIIENSNTDKEIWLCTTQEIKEKFPSVPSNIKIFSDTCMVVTPIEELGIKCLATDSTKCAHYSQNLSKIKTLVNSRQELINKINL